jgi:hypothetical protein
LPACRADGPALGRPLAEAAQEHDDRMLARAAELLELEASRVKSVEPPLEAILDVADEP